MNVVDAGEIPVGGLIKWNSKELRTIGGTCEAMETLKNKEEAQQFLALARAANPEHADANIGYLMGYFSRPRWAQLAEWFGIKHPIFGDRFDLTEDEIFQMGIERGKAAARAKK